VPITVTAPFTLTPRALSTSYIGGDADYWVENATKIMVGLYLDGTGLVAGVAKVRWGIGASVEIPIPADNLLPLEVANGAVLPPIQIDVKADAGTPTLVLVAFGKERCGDCNHGAN
jgi:hypothetical protein